MTRTRKDMEERAVVVRGHHRKMRKIPNNREIVLKWEVNTDPWVKASSAPKCEQNGFF